MCAFRSPPLSDDYTYDLVQKEFEKWDSIQYFLLSNPNRTLNECQMIKQRALKREEINLRYVEHMIKQISENEG